MSKPSAESIAWIYILIYRVLHQQYLDLLYITYIYPVPLGSIMALPLWF